MTHIVDEADLDRLDFSKGDGLVTVVVQDASSGAVLMLAHANRESLALSLSSGEMHYQSRTRGLWRKGATSGNVQRVVSLAHDCDADAVLAQVTMDGPACHEGRASCFGTVALTPDTFATLDALIDSRARSSDAPSTSYTKRLLTDRNLRLKKLGEECAELVTALADVDPGRSAEEAADVIYHVLVALRAGDVRLADVRARLAQRAAG